MSLQVVCGQCQSSYLLNDRVAGQRVKCRQCGGPIDVPGAATAKPSPPSPQRSAPKAPSSRQPQGPPPRPSPPRPAPQLQPRTPMTPTPSVQTTAEVVACQGCGRKFRLPPGQSSYGLKCKQCGKPLADAPPPSASLPRQGSAPALADLFGDDIYGVGAGDTPLSPLQPVGRSASLSPAKSAASARPEKARRKNRRTHSLPSIPPGAIAWGIFGAIGLLFVIAFVVPPLAFVIGFYLMIGSLFVCLAGVLWTVVRAFQDDPVKALMCLFVPFYGLIYSHMTYAENRGPTRTIFTGLGMFGVGIIVFCITFGAFNREISRLERSGPGHTGAYDLKALSHPTFENRRAPTSLVPGVTVSEVSVGMLEGNSPGFYRSKMWLYLPEGQHSPKSLSCVLITEAGTNLFTGVDCGNLNVPPGHPEHVPYVQAGMAVLAFGLDGPMEGNPDQLTYSDLLNAYAKFRDSYAGVINAHNALEYVLDKVPEVDPSRIFIAGHSSAGTLALLFAEHEPRLRGCVAYAPCTDVAGRLRPLVGQLGGVALPGVDSFLVRSSPLTHVSRLQCPVMIFHAQDDSNVPVNESTTFANMAKQAGKHVDLVTVPTGDHYQAMIDQGIPTGLQWFTHITQGATPAATPPTATQ